MSRGPKLVELKLELRHETEVGDPDDGAFLLFDGEREAWVPKSMCEDNRDGSFTMPEWKAKEVGFV